jgi:hypothetical protein
MVKVQGVASHDRPFDVWTAAPPGTVFTVQASVVPLVTVAQAERLAEAATTLIAAIAAFALRLNIVEAPKRLCDETPG